MGKRLRRQEENCIRPLEIQNFGKAPADEVRYVSNGKAADGLLCRSAWIIPPTAEMDETQVDSCVLAGSN
jgi:hypothetical protein